MTFPDNNYDKTPITVVSQHAAHAAGYKLVLKKSISICFRKWGTIFLRKQ